MKIMIVSLHFGPGHIAHLKAWYKMCRLCDYDASMYVNKEYNKFFDCNKYKMLLSLDKIEEYKPDIVLLYNFGIENLQFVQWCRKNRIKVIYVLHEPYMGVRELLKDGTYIFKQATACILNYIICNKATRVMLCSDYAVTNCKKYMRVAYKKHIRFPLIFEDEYLETDVEERKYFSLIGTYASSKGSDLFLRFIKESVCAGYDIDFQIATRSDMSELLNEPVFKNLIESGKLIVQQGKAMTQSEINEAYRRSLCCWNGYRRSTQSGVLPNAFMMGTPVLASRQGSFEEFVRPGENGEFIDASSLTSIYDAYIQIKQNSEHMTNKCRENFLEKFSVQSQMTKFKSIIRELCDNIN